MNETIIIGMSGGVDSAVAASILIQDGYNVEALFMKNWDENDKEFCTAARDYKDALQVCDKLNIPLRSIDLTKEYPLECIPFDGTANTKSSFFTLILSRIFLFETIPTLKPAKSNLSFE